MLFLSMFRKNRLLYLINVLVNIVSIVKVASNHQEKKMRDTYCSLMNSFTNLVIKTTAVYTQKSDYEYKANVKCVVSPFRVLKLMPFTNIVVII